MANGVTHRTRVVLTGLSPRAYEHPADRAALSALRRIPAFDVMVRRTVGFVGERSVRHMHLASAVRVGPDQFSHLHALYVDCVRTLDLPQTPELYVAQTPLINAGAIGVDQPFVVLASAALELFDDDELRMILGHELGHILSDHALYKTVLALLTRLAFGPLGVPIGGLAIAGLLAALREWDRKSELSADRAGLLCAQDPEAAYRMHMKLAGGSRVGEMSVDAFMAQARDYEEGGDVVDGAVKLFNLLGRTHPFHVIRVAELQRWVQSGAYDRVRSGDYPHREDGPQTSVYSDVADAARSYREGIADSRDPLKRWLQDVGEAGSGALQRARDFLQR